MTVQFTVWQPGKNARILTASFVANAATSANALTPLEYILHSRF